MEQQRSSPEADASAAASQSMAPTVADSGDIDLLLYADLDLDVKLTDAINGIKDPSTIQTTVKTETADSAQQISQAGATAATATGMSIDPTTYY